MFGGNGKRLYNIAVHVALRVWFIKAIYLSNSLSPILAMTK